MRGIYGVLALRPVARPEPGLLARMGAVTRHRELAVEALR